MRHILKRIYISCSYKLYHEATLMNLLEIMLFYQSSVESIGDAMVDLLDYCTRHIYALNIKAMNPSFHDELNVPAKRTAQEIDNFNAPAELGVCVSVYVCMYYVSILIILYVCIYVHIYVM